MNDYLAAAKKAGQAEVFEVHSWRTPVRFEANQLKSVQTKESATVAVRIIKDGRVGFAVGSGLVPPEELVGMAVDTAQFGPEAVFEFPSSNSFPAVEVYDPAIETISIEDMIDLEKGVIAQLRDHTSDITCEGSVTRQVSEVRLTNSCGGEARYRHSQFSLNVEGVLVREDDLLFVGDGQSDCRPFTDVGRVLETTKRQLELARVVTAVPTRQMPVIFTPIGVASALMTPLAVAFNGKTVVEGASPLKGRQGQAAFSPKFNLWDDATLPFRPSSCPCDDEGVPSQRTTLVGEGVVGDFLFDLRMAKLAGVRSTGSGRRSGGAPSPAISSLVVGEGDKAFDDMLREMGEGLVVEIVMGAEQGNILSGDFAGNVLLGFAVKNGEMVGRVKDTVVSGNVYQALSHIVALSRESRWVGGFLRSPYICCSGLSVAAKGV